VALTLHREFDAKVGSELADQMARLYAASFTERELRDLLVFFKTPVGQKFLREEPPVISATIPCRPSCRPILSGACLRIQLRGTCVAYIEQAGTPSAAAF
jgi:hypothetical protein